MIEYFYVANGAAAGPVLIEALTGLVANATINGRTLVWYDGLANWIPADDLPELDEALANAVPAVPASEQYRLMMIGTWSATSTNNLGVTTTLEARYLSNGSFTGVVTLSGMGTVSAQPISGTWSVEVVSEGRFTLTTQPQNGTPSTAVLRVVNQNTLQNETDGYTARRVR